MARLPRLTVPGQPHHIIQRGNNRQPIFASAEDRGLLLHLVEEHARKHQVAVHAYLLLETQFHLLATPERDDAIPQMMQGIGRSYVRHFNLRHARTGTLWEGRYRATVIQAGRYLLPCMTYLDLSPVEAGLAAEAADYAWSSHLHYIGRRTDRLITPHALYWELGNTPFARDEAYGNLVRAGVSEAAKHSLTDSAMRGWALGDDAYVAELQRKTERRLVPGIPGRPRRMV